MQVSNNISSFNVWKNYTNNVSSLRDSMSKLSSGSRINNAGDDPSGLAMSERLRIQTRNTSAAASNVENKLNYLQTADSWMQKMHDMLGRMGELAVMANDGTKSTTDKDILQKEFAQMQDEMKRITGATTSDTDAAGKFNGLRLFQAVDADSSGALDGVIQQVGADGGQTFEGVALDLTAANTDVIYTDLGADGSSGGGDDTVFTWGSLLSSTTDGSGLNIGSSGEPGMAVGAINAGIDYLSGKRADVGAEIKRMDQTLDGLRSYEENISATESRIRDVDVAKETAEMSKYNILQQVGTAMLAQANQLPQGVLQLLG
ncbi:flagellin [Pontiellaceae bacterium B12219]|nr:flagellin [Pontiellaceae bacterium B12219]